MKTSHIASRWGYALAPDYCHKKFLTFFALVALPCLSAVLTMMPGSASATPAFAVQTSQPCASCHIGAYGPQLTSYGRDFKLYGYTADDGKKHFPPVAIMARETFTNTRVDQTHQHGFGKNNNIAVGEVSLFYTGKITDNIGAYLEPIAYDGSTDLSGWANMDIRMIHEGTVHGLNYVAGLTANDAPTVSDIWNSTNQWSWPFDSSALAPTPVASTLVGDGQAQFQVLGVGAYTMINDWVYLEADLYHGLSAGTRNIVAVPVSGTDTYDGVMPYWRAAIQHEFDHEHQNFEVGTLGMVGNVHPGGDNTLSATDEKSDVGVDANYQWYGQNSGADNRISAHAIYVHEDLNLNASKVLVGSNSTDSLEEIKTNVSYSYKNTWTPTIGYFHMRGSKDANYWGTSTGSASPNSAGYIAEITFVPWGKPGSPFPGSNLRFELQYTAYTQFDGVQSHASDNNTLFFNIGYFIDPMPYL